jgi:hypothetical protein
MMRLSALSLRYFDEHQIAIGWFAEAGSGNAVRPVLRTENYFRIARHPP